LKQFNNENLHRFQWLEETFQKMDTQRGFGFCDGSGLANDKARLYDGNVGCVGTGKSLHFPKFR